MRIIPVFDLKQGMLVHAERGVRQNYKPLRTPLLPGPDPELACDTLVRLGFNRVYIADLDAITKSGDNFDLVRRLVGMYPIEVWLDAGLSGPRDIPLLDVPQVTLIAGSETLAAISSLPEISRKVGASRIVFSLDTRNGEVLTPDSTLKDVDPVNLAAKVLTYRIRKMILLDLGAVGSRAGLNKVLLKNLTQQVPGAKFFPGGGMTAEDITELKRMNIPGALTATALYSQQIAAAPEL